MGEFNVATELFKGPLEMLLTLIEDRKLSISQVSLAEVTDAYIAYVEHLPELPLGETAQFIVVASTLLLIKSRTLLPTLDLSEEERESVQELERRLARYKVVRNASKRLRELWGVAPLMFPAHTPASPHVFVPGITSLAGLQEAAQRIVSLLPKPQKLAQAAVAPVVALEEVIANLKTRLTSAFRASFAELTKTKPKGEVIVHFLAILELVRSGSASATQDDLFTDILIESELTGLPKYG